MALISTEALLIIHSLPQTCALASPNAANGCAVLIDLLPPMGVLISLLASMPWVHCHFNWLQCHRFIAVSIGFNAMGSLPLSIGFNATGSLPFIWLNTTGSLPLSIGFIALSWVHCLSHRDTPAPQCLLGTQICLSGAPSAFMATHLPYGAPHASRRPNAFLAPKFALVAPHLPLWQHICLIAPHMPHGAPMPSWRPNLP